MAVRGVDLMRGGGFGLAGGLLRSTVCWMLLLLLLHPAPSRSAHQLRDIGWLQDATGQMTIADVAALDPAQFVPAPTGVVAAGYARGALWVRMVINAPPGEWWLNVLPPFTDNIQLHILDPDRPGHHVQYRAGDLLPFSQRSPSYRGFIFKVVQADDRPRIALLRMQGANTLLAVPRLQSPGEFQTEVQLEYALLGALFSMLVFALLINLATAPDDSLSRWFSGLIAALVLLMLGNTGLAAQFIFPESPLVVDALPKLAALAVTSLSHGFYARILSIGPDQRMIRRLYLLGVLIPLLAMPLVWADAFVAVMPWILAGAILSTVGSLVLVLLRLTRRRDEWLVLVGLYFSLVGYLGGITAAIGIPTGPFITLNSLPLASFGFVLAMHFVVAARRRSAHDAAVVLGLQFEASERERIREAESRLQQGRLISMLAHELRNALTVLRMAFALQPMSNSVVASAERAISNMDTVIERTLLADRIADGAVNLETGLCDVAEIVRGIVAGSQAPERVQLQAPSDLIADTDASLLNVIVVNLVENALKYGSGEIHVELRPALDGGVQQGFVIEVGNAEGRAGRPDPERLFEKYYRANRAHGYTGSGLGLHLSRHMARRLGGDLCYLPRPGWIWFSLALPLRIG